LKNDPHLRTRYRLLKKSGTTWPGTLPVVIARIDRFIAEHGKDPYPDME
jgi:hypothetical protein